ncbi:hypothetical protein NGM10_08750 [Halorussus salilacus]|uniref:hypothetical protein n=1 Tax=Halorussus salilacus TaxID=2953750 RepID=UPI0020A1FCC8|nr:hypothetical protein [Halorussus salilacus]USZ66819.1 hypothetical protein NGM10_08750 [Halorussus salilacus]
MSSSVELSDRAKRRLEQLQAKIEVATDREVSQREVLDRIVSRGYESKRAVVASFRDEAGTRSDDDWEGLSEDEIDAFLSETFASGAETDEDDIDKILYGE